MNTIQSRYDVVLHAIPGIPLIEKGDNLGKVIMRCVRKAELKVSDNDIFIVTSKIVSKAEGRLVSLKTIHPSAQAIKIAKKSGKDQRIVELMLKEGKIVDVKPGLVITLHRLGFICTSAAVDRANTGKPEEELVSLLPKSPDQSAGRIRNAIKRITDKNVAVIINDSFGIQYRCGSVGMAVGVSGIPAVLRGKKKEKDLYGKKRGVGISFADEIAAAASLLMGQSNAALPVVLMHGLRYPRKQGKAIDLIEIEQIAKEVKIKEF